MLSSRDLYTYFQTFPIAAADTTIGTLVVEYEVREYTDVRNLGERRSYAVTCKQRVVISNDGAKSLGQTVVSFTDYPVMLVNSIAAAPSSGVSWYLSEYSPRTLNSAVSTSTGASTDSGSSSSTSITTQQTSGSSVSETNSYDVSVSLGFFGDSATGSATYGQGHSDTTTRDSSRSLGQSAGRDAQRSSGTTSSSSMSVKDWASYSNVDPGNQAPSWIWSQEYPWNPIQYQNVVNGIVTVPDFIAARLWDSKTQQIYPPSQLSLFGINFVSVAKWILAVDGSPGATDETVTFTHQLRYFTGSHSINPNPPRALLVQLSDESDFEFTSPALDLVALALDPILPNDARGSAVVGFVASQFIAPPATGSGFRIKSRANDLLVSGSGFGALGGDSALMTTDFSAGGQATLSLSFKIVDPDEEKALFIKHWKTTEAGVVVSVVVNNNAPIYRHVDSLEAGGGDDNLTSITLRNHNYASAEFCDYLVMGLNTITITLSPSLDAEGQAKPCGYAIRALAIE